MNYYYLMNTEQKDSVATEALECVPKSSLDGSKWILESNTPGLDCLTLFEDDTQCVLYIKENAVEWDEFYNV